MGELRGVRGQGARSCLVGGYMAPPYTLPRTPRNRHKSEHRFWHMIERAGRGKVVRIWRCTYGCGGDELARRAAKVCANAHPATLDAVDWRQQLWLLRNSIDAELATVRSTPRLGNWLGQALTSQMEGGAA